MSEKKILVPREMVQSAVQATCAVKLGMSEHDRLVRAVLEDALLWLSENPIVPTPEQMESMAQSLNSPWSICYIPFIAEWQRRMFLAPEPSIDPLVMYIMRHFDDGDTDPRTLRNRADAAVADYKEHVKRNG